MSLRDASWCFVPSDQKGSHLAIPRLGQTSQCPSIPANALVSQAWHKRILKSPNTWVVSRLWSSLLCDKAGCNWVPWPNTVGQSSERNLSWHALFAMPPSTRCARPLCFGNTKLAYITYFNHQRGRREESPTRQTGLNHVKFYYVLFMFTSSNQLEPTTTFSTLKLANTTHGPKPNPLARWLAADPAHKGAESRSRWGRQPVQSHECNKSLCATRSY